MAGGIDVATLQVNVQQTGVDQTTAALLGLASAADKAQASTRLTSDQVSAAAARFDALYGKAAQAASAVDYNTRSMALMQAQATEMDAALGRVNTTFDTAGAGLGRVRQGLVSLAAQATGTIPVVDRIGASLLTIGAGGATALVVIAGLAAIAEGYSHLTASIREAQAAADAFAKSEAGRQAASTGQGILSNDVLGASSIPALDEQAQKASLAVRGLEHELEGLTKTTPGSYANVSSGWTKEIADLARDLLTGGVDATQLAASLRALPDPWSKSAQDVATWGEQVIAARAALDAANNTALQARAIQRYYTQELGASTTAEGQLIEKTRERQQILTAYQTGGVLAGKQAEAEVAAYNAAREAYDHYASSAKGGAEATLAFQDALTRGDPIAKAYLADQQKLADINERIAAQSTVHANTTAIAGSETATLLKQIDAQYKSLQKVNEQDNIENLQVAQKNALFGVLGGQRKLMEAYDVAELESYKARHSLTGVELEDRLQQIELTKQQAAATAELQIAQDNQKQLAATQLEIQKQAEQQVTKNVELTKKQTTETAKEIIANQQFARTLTSDVLQAFDQIARHGTLSFASIASAVDQLTARLLKLPHLSDDAAAHLKDVNLAIASAGAGFAFGQQAGSLGNGAVGGGVQGAAVGFETGGVPGAVIGGLSGAIGGLLGAAEAHKEAATALKQAAQSFSKSATSFIGGPQSSVASELAQNVSTAATLIQQWNQLLQAAFKQGKGAVESFLNNNPTPTAITAGEATNAATIAQNFFDGITHQLNALRGPAGDFDNQLFDLAKAYQQNIKDSEAAGGSVADLTKITVLYTEAVVRAKAAEQERIRVQTASIALATESALATSDAARRKLAQDQLAEQEAERLFQLQQDGADALTLAAETQRDAAEQAALAAQQAQAAWSEFTNNLTQQFQVFGTNAQDQLATFAAAAGFTGLTLAQVQAEYIKDTGAGLTDDQKALDDKIAEFVQLYNAANGGGGSLTGAAVSDTFNRTAIGTVTGISDSQAVGILGRIDTSNLYLHEIAVNSRRIGTGGVGLFGSASNSAGAVNLSLTIVNNDAADLIAVLSRNTTLARAFDLASGRGASRNRAGIGAKRD